MRKIEFADFELRIGRGRRKKYPVWVIRSPAGEASGTFTMPFSAGKVESIKTIIELAMLRSRERTRSALASELKEIKAFGGELFDALFQGPVGSCYESSLRIAISQSKGLRLKLRIEPPELASLPWEFLYDKQNRKFLALSIRTVLVRYIETPYAAQPLLVQPPLRLLVVIASPINYPELDVEREKRRILQALGEREEQGILLIDFLENATLPALQNRLRESEYHILHFIGHGGYDEDANEGVLILEDEWKRGKRVRGEYLGRLMGDHFSLRLVILNACEGARTAPKEVGPYDPFPGVAETLVHEGIPAVIAMQFPVTDEAAMTFARELYEALADNWPVDAAVAEARKRIEYTLRNTVEWAAPVLHMRAPDGVIFQVPHRAVVEAREKKVSRLYGQAREAMEQERWGEAVSLLERVVSLDPAHPEAAQTLAVARAELARGEGLIRLWNLTKAFLRQVGSLLLSEARRPAFRALAAGVITTVLVAMLGRIGVIQPPMPGAVPEPTATLTPSPTWTVSFVPPTFTITPSLTPSFTPVPSKTPTLTATPTPTYYWNPNGTVNVNVNCREGPDVAYAVKRVLPLGTRVRVLGRTRSDWYLVETHDGEMGWVYGEFVTLEPAEASIPVVPKAMIPTLTPRPDAFRPTETRPPASKPGSRTVPSETPTPGPPTPVPTLSSPTPKPTSPAWTPTPRPPTPTSEPSLRPPTPTPGG
jgi:uncharacterized protein YraI